MPTCSVAGCGRNTSARGLCGKHYQRLMNNGDPNIKRSLKGESAEYRFWSRVTKTEACWIWNGPKTRDGYGRLMYQDKTTVRAHRLSYLLNVGPIAEGMCVLHRCDNPSCVNPGHLYVGTHHDNASDRDIRGRGNIPSRSGANHWMKREPERVARGESFSRSSITDEAVRMVRSRYACGDVTQKALADEFGITRKNLHLILRMKTWKHVV